MQEMDKAFDFKTAQERWYATWEASRIFEGKNSRVAISSST